MRKKLFTFLLAMIASVGTMLAWDYERVKDLSKIAADRAAFLEQKDTAGGKKTMKAYLWKVCGDAYDTQHSND